MDIKIDERLVGGVTVLDIVGKLTMDQAAQHLTDKVNCLISQQRTHIVLNLKNVPYIDSGGLGQLVASYGSVMKTGGALKLLNVGSRNHDLLSITRLVTLFESFDSETDAVQSFETITAPAASHLGAIVRCRTSRPKLFRMEGTSGARLRGSSTAAHLRFGRGMSEGWRSGVSAATSSGKFARPPKLTENGPRTSYPSSHHIH
jgi:anti-sigma B factor antagonist